MENLQKQVGNRIRAQRKAQGLSQEHLAEQASLHPTYIGEIERGDTNPSLATLQSVADALRINIGDLIPSPTLKEPTSETELLTSQILGLVRSEPPHIQKVLLNVLKSLIAELRKMG